MGAGVKVVTINMCLPVSGLTNKRLPKLCSLGGFLFGPPLFVALVYFTWTHLSAQARAVYPFPLDRPADPLKTTIALAVAIYAPIAALVGFVFAVQGGRLLGAMHMALTGVHDFKLERIDEMVKVVSEYDVVLVQEIYKGSPAFLDADIPGLLAKRAKEAGFEHFVFADKVSKHETIFVDAGTGKFCFSSSANKSQPRLPSTFLLLLLLLLLF